MIPETCIHAEHSNMLQVQAELSEKYKYKPLPPILSAIQREEYERYLPEEFRSCKPETPIYTTKGTLICTRLTNRKYVCGDYGIFLEADASNMVFENIKTRDGQEYRMCDPQYKDHVKYFWMTAKDLSRIKIYWQQKRVDYADYVPGKYYFSPYEARLEP